MHASIEFGHFSEREFCSSGVGKQYAVPGGGVEYAFLDHYQAQSLKSSKVGAF